MLPSIDKANRNPVPPTSNQVRKIDQNDKVHPRDYAFEMDQVLEKEKHHHQQQHPFGEDTFEPSEEQNTEETPEEEKPVPKDISGSSNHEQNIDITV